MNIDIDFGDLRIKMDEEIIFDKRPEISFLVSSGNGTPGNGGTFIRYKDEREPGLFTLKLMTRKLLGDNFSEDLDIFSFWSYKGKTLRSIYLEQSDDL